MKSIWKGVIAFGLVTIPIRVVKATEEHAVKFRQLHGADKAPINYARVCSSCRQPVAFEDIVHGYEVDKDDFVVLTEQDLDAIPLESARSIEIAQFVELDEIDPIMLQASYYLVPDKLGIKAYSLLRETMRTVRRAGIAKVTFRSKEHLACLRLTGDVLTLGTMYWPDEIREPSFSEIRQAPALDQRELDMARQLVDGLTSAWEPAGYQDVYRERLLSLIETKKAGKPITVVQRPDSSKVIDLMAALKASVEQTAASAPAKPRAGKPASKASRAKPKAKKRAAS